MAETIAAELVKKLREKIGCGFMECKKALTETNGNLDKAIEVLRKAGAAKAEKKSDRAASQGIVLIKTSPDNKVGFMVEINCETDFVANDANFKKFGQDVIETGFAAKASDLDNLLNLVIKESGQTITAARQALIAQIGENIQVRRMALLKSDAGVIGAYSHSGKAGSLLQLSIADLELAKDLAMHVVGLKPQCVSAKDLNPELVNKEKEIYLAQVIQTGKPANIAEKIVAGKLEKFISENTLLGQQFVKDPNVKIADLLKNKKAEVIGFVRFSLGEI